VRGQTAKFKYDSMLKTDTASRYAAYATALSSGFLTVDEVRDRENLESMDYEEGEFDDETDASSQVQEVIDEQ
jgi:phage portal protein BeeE